MDQTKILKIFVAQKNPENGVKGYLENQAYENPVTIYQSGKSSLKKLPYNKYKMWSSMCMCLLNSKGTLPEKLDVHFPENKVMFYC